MRRRVEKKGRERGGKERYIYGKNFNGFFEVWDTSCYD